MAMNDPTPLSEKDRELAARSAVLVGRFYEMHGWTWGARDTEHTPGAESIAETIGYLIGYCREKNEASTRRLFVRRNDVGIEVYLHLGTLDEDGTVDVDDELGPKWRQ